MPLRLPSRLAVYVYDPVLHDRPMLYGVPQEFESMLTDMHSNRA